VSHDPGKVMNFQYLEKLNVGQCENLKSLFCMKAHRSLPQLKDLAIYECHELEEIIAGNGELVQISNSEVYFPKLTTIEVYNCDKLRSLFSVVVVRMLPQLRYLCISNATQLE